MTETSASRRPLRRGAIALGKAVLWLAYVMMLFQIGGMIYFRLPYAQPIGSYGYPRDIYVRKGGGMDYGYKPGYHGAFSGGAYNDVTIDINLEGYRDRNFGPKPAGKTRVAVVGDSVVFGAGVTAAQRFTDRLQAQLSADRKPVEVYNFGVNSYGFRNDVGVMGSPEMRRFAPDVVVVGFVVNDLEPSGWPKDLPKAEPNLAESLGFEAYNLAASRLFCQIRDYLHYFMMAANPDVQYHTKYMQSVIKEFHDRSLLAGFDGDRVKAEQTAAELQAKLVVALLPEINVLRDPASFDLARTLPKQRFLAENVAVCDLYDHFAQAAPEHLESLFLPHDDMHFSPAGHQLAALGLRQCLAL